MSQSFILNPLCSILHHQFSSQSFTVAASPDVKTRWNSTNKQRSLPYLVPTVFILTTSDISTAYPTHPQADTRTRPYTNSRLLHQYTTPGHHHINASPQHPPHHYDSLHRITKSPPREFPALPAF